MISKNNNSSEQSQTTGLQKTTSTWKHLVVHLCILVYFTSTGSPQAGLLEVGICAFFFTVLFHFVVKFFPLVSKIITSLLIIGFSVALIFINYHFLKVVKKDAPLEQLLVGDLFVKKIMKTVKNESTPLKTEEELLTTTKGRKQEGAAPLTNLDKQLTVIIAKPVTAEVKSPKITKLATVNKGGFLLETKKQGNRLVSKNLHSEIPLSEMTIKKDEQMVTAFLEKRALKLLSHLSCIHDELNFVLTEQKIQAPFPEPIMAAIHFTEVHSPFIEDKTPVK